MRRTLMPPPSVILLALLPALSGCEESPTAPDAILELPRALSASEQVVVQATNRFAVDLLGRVHAAAPDSTVFLSPFSASMALGMTMNGAAGATLEQMRSTLGFGTLPLSDVNASYRGLLDLLASLDSHVD